MLTEGSTEHKAQTATWRLSNGSVFQ